MGFAADAFINRELSWLEFNQRVLEQAMYGKVPLLERLKFLAITASNLDEFFMVRVGSLQIQEEQSPDSKDPTGLTPAEQLVLVHDRVDQIVHDQYSCYLEQIEPNLRAEGLEHIHIEEASLRHREAAERVFHDEIYPILSPMHVTTDNFPLLNNLGLYLCVRVKAESLLTTAATDGQESNFFLIPIGPNTPRFITLPSDRGYSYALLEDIAANFIGTFFPSSEVLECVPFRITRNSDISVREDGAADLMRGMEKVLSARRVADSVRIEIATSASEQTTSFLQKALQLSPRDLFRIPGPLDLASMMHLTNTEGFPGLRDSVWTPQRSPLIDPSVSMFQTIAQQDVLLCHPYESFEPVVRWLEEAAEDPDVLAIKQVLYRTSRRSSIVSALKRAAERGKYVTAVLELKARFDEARNIEWARELERAGVQVIYGVKWLKTHAKVCIVVRREPHGIVRYCHFGTGNYNESTARMYSDISYLTCDEQLGNDASSFFNAIAGFSQPQQFQRLEMAPIGLRRRLLMLIEGETQRKKQGQRAHIAAKLNSLVDPELIEALYKASQAGVTIRLNIRGQCCLKPGVPGLSENIHVVSIVDRFLEHARVLYFYHGGDELIFISSADWMPRNLDRRIELLVPIEDPTSQRRLISILDTYFRDNQNAWELQPDGTYVRLSPGADQSKFRAQRVLYDTSVAAIQQVEQTRHTTFQPHQASITKHN
jgi:polyphosphate kinase